MNARSRVSTLKGRTKKTLATSIGLMFLMVLGSFITPSAHAATGSAADTIVFSAMSTTQAVAALQSGAIDVYDFALTPTQAASLQGTPGIKLEKAPSAFDDLILNPAPVFVGNLSGDQTSQTRTALASQFGGVAAAITNVYYDSTKKLTFVEFGAYPGKSANPFAFKAIRFAMNYLVDRDSAANTIFGGQAVPMYTFRSQYDPDYTVIADVVLKYKFSYNPQLTADTVSSVLSAAGGTFSGGKWLFDGKPIAMTYIIRIEDQRLDMGNAFASASENLGLVIKRNYLTFGPALNIAQGTDPKLFQWSMYTEGFSKNSISKYDSGAIAQFDAPWFGQMPGRGQTGWWQYQNSTIDTTTKKIFTGNFTNQDQRNSLYRQGTEVGIQESVRLYQITQLSSYPVSTALKGITNDAGAGLRARYDVREWNVPGRTTVNVGHNHVYTSTTTWNPVGGFGDIYSVDPFYPTYDPWTATDPFNGLPIPFRAPFAVSTAGPTGKLAVPSSAFTWNATAGSWTNVPANSQATSRVNFDLSQFIGTKWHDGSTFSYGDVLGSIAQTFDIAYNKTKANLEPSISASTKTTTDTIVGFAINSANKSFTVYVNYWHFSPNYIAAYASQSFAMPYEMVFAMDSLVFNQKTYAYSQSAAGTRKVPWLNLVLTGHAADVQKTLDGFVTNNFFPAKWFTVAGVAYATASEAATRFTAASNWIATHQHAWISDGPMYLDTFSAQGDTLTLRAWRDSTYPFSAGKWVFGEPPTVKITNVGLPSVTKGQPANLLVDINGPPPLHVEYILRDSVKGTIITVGTGTVATGSRFTVALSGNLTGKLTATFPYEVTIIAFSDSVASVDASTQFLNVFDPGVITAPIQSSVSAINATQNQVLAALGNKIDNVSGSLRQVITSISTGSTQNAQSAASLQQSVSSLKDTSQTLLYIVAAVVVLQLATVAFVIVKKR